MQDEEQYQLTFSQAYHKLVPVVWLSASLSFTSFFGENITHLFLSLSVSLLLIESPIDYCSSEIWHDLYFGLLWQTVPRTDQKQKCFSFHAHFSHFYHCYEEFIHLMISLMKHLKIYLNVCFQKISHCFLHHQAHLYY